MIPDDKRRFFRVNVVDAYAHCRFRDHAGRYKVRNLSCGGALLLGEPQIEVGSEFEAMLFLPGLSSIVLTDAVSRRVGLHRKEPYTAIEFTSMGAQDREIMARVVFQEFYRNLFPSVLVGSSQPSESSALARDLQAMGYSPIQATTPLAMIKALEEPGLSIQAVVMGMSLGTADGLEFASFLADCYPEIRRIMVTHRDSRHCRQTRKLVHATVPKPWKQDDLRRALGLRPTIEAPLPSSPRIASELESCYGQP